MAVPGAADAVFVRRTNSNSVDLRSVPLSLSAESGRASPASYGGSSGKGMRSRSLSETGRMLLAGFLHPHMDLPWQTEMKSEQDAKEKRANTSSKAASRIRSKAIKRDQKKREEEESAAANYFALIGSDDEETTHDAYEDFISRNSSTPIEVRLDPHSHPAAARTVDRIDESTFGEEDGAEDEWETVPKKVRASGQKKKPTAPKAPSPGASSSNPYWSDDDLYDLQQSTFGARQIGSSKKSMQFKATEKRNYGIAKRERQRGGR
jgi:hypothetical protein